MQFFIWALAVPLLGISAWSFYEGPLLPWAGGYISPTKPPIIVLGWWNFSDHRRPRRPVYEGETAYDFATYKPNKSEIPLQPSFSIKQYLGIWYELFYTKDYPYDLTYMTESGSNFFENHDGTYGVANRGWMANKGMWWVDYGMAREVEPARLAIQFVPWAPPADYRILYTDYRNLACVYSEADFQEGNEPQKYAWILSRRPALFDEVLEKAFQVFDQVANITKSDFVKTKHGIAPRSALTPLPTGTPMKTTTLASTTPKPIDPKLEKCRYEITQLRCFYIKPRVVYDRRNNVCIFHSRGCSVQELQKASFSSLTECEETCVIEGEATETPYFPTDYNRWS